MSVTEQRNKDFATPCRIHPQPGRTRFGQNPRPGLPRSLHFVGRFPGRQTTPAIWPAELAKSSNNNSASSPSTSNRSSRKPRAATATERSHRNDRLSAIRNPQSAIPNFLGSLPRTPEPDARPRLPHALTHFARSPRQRLQRPDRFLRRPPPRLPLALCRGSRPATLLLGTSHPRPHRRRGPPRFPH
jgi:hypothetical protein